MKTKTGDYIKSLLTFLITIMTGVAFAVPVNIGILNSATEPASKENILSEVKSYLNNFGVAFKINILEDNEVNDVILLIGKQDKDQFKEQLNIPTIFSLVSINDCNDSKITNQSSINYICIANEQSDKRFIDLAVNFFPQTKSITTIIPYTDKADGSRLLNRYQSLIPPGKTFNTIHTDINNNINLDLLRKSLQANTVFVMFPISNLYNKNNIQEILINTYYKNVPVIGFSQSLAKAGAAASVYSTVNGITLQIAEYIREISLGKFNINGIQNPKYFDLKFNKPVIESLDEKYPDETEIENLRDILK